MDDVKHNLVHFITSGDHKDETRTSLRKLPDGSWEEGDRQLMLTAVEYREVFNNAFPMETMARIIAAIPKSTLVRFHVIDHLQQRLGHGAAGTVGRRNNHSMVVVPQVNPKHLVNYAILSANSNVCKAEKELESLEQRFVVCDWHNTRLCVVYFYRRRDVWPVCQTSHEVGSEHWRIVGSSRCRVSTGAQRQRHRIENNVQLFVICSNFA